MYMTMDKNILEYRRRTIYDPSLDATHVQFLQHFWNMTDVEYVVWGLHSKVGTTRATGPRTSRDYIQTVLPYQYANPALSFGAAATTIDFMLCKKRRRAN